MPQPSLAVVVREWGRIGVIGVGGPPAHIALLRRLCVDRRRWLGADEFEDAIAACNLLPGPASTQLAIYCGFRIRGRAGAVAGGLAFVLPGLVSILALAAVFLARHPPAAIAGAAAGAGSGVAAVAVQAAVGLAPASRARAASSLRWLVYLAAGGVTAALTGPWVVLVLIACGLAELAVTAARPPALSLASLAWVAFKVGALSYGGGFVIVPLMQGDAVHAHHWLTAPQFTTAVALGQVTPGPVVHTVTAVGYAAAGIGGGLLAAALAFAPSFLFVLAGGRRFDALRGHAHARRFLGGAAPAAVGAILGSAVPLADALVHWWQFVLLGAAAVALLVARLGVVPTLVALGAIGALVESLS